MEKKMNNFNISSSFNINNTIYFIDYHKMLILGLTTPKISTAKIIGIYITSDNIRYDYQGKTNSGSFYEKDINKKFFHHTRQQRIVILLLLKILIIFRFIC
jgi:hypothetical protein